MVSIIADSKSSELPLSVDIVPVVASNVLVFTSVDFTLVILPVVELIVVIVPVAPSISLPLIVSAAVMFPP